MSHYCTTFTESLVNLAESIEWSMLPDKAVNAATEAILDGTGVMLAGWGEPCSDIVLRHVGETFAPGSASLIGEKLRLAPPGAALLNGTLAHALDFDDTAWSYVGHPTAVILPAALAVGEYTGASGRQLVEAYVAGFEVASCIGSPVVEIFAQKGWHLTSTVGIFGACIAASKLLGLDSDQIAQGLGLAASHASGLKASFGWAIKPYHAGMAARGGVESALLAKSGLSASRTVFDERLGYFQAFASIAPQDVVQKDLQIVTDGIALKRYPSCTGSHPAIEAVLAIHHKHGILAGNVEQIICRTTPEVLNELLYPFPENVAQSKFSMSFPVSVALSEGELELEHFSEEMLRKSQIRELMKRCETIPDVTLERPLGVNAPAAVVEIRLKNGKTISHRVDSATGNPQNPLPFSEISKKFRGCALRRLKDEQQISALRDVILNLPDVKNIREITELTRPQ